MKQIKGTAKENEEQGGPLIIVRIRQDMQRYKRIKVLKATVFFLSCCGPSFQSQCQVSSNYFALPANKTPGERGPPTGWGIVGSSVC